MDDEDLWLFACVVMELAWRQGMEVPAVGTVEFDRKMEEIKTRLNEGPIGSTVERFDSRPVSPIHPANQAP